MEERMHHDKVYPKLITVMILFGEHHLELHTDTTPRKAVKKAAHTNAESIVAVDPLNAIQLAKDLIDAAYYSKVTAKKNSDVP